MSGKQPGFGPQLLDALRRDAESGKPFAPDSHRNGYGGKTAATMCHRP